MQTNPDIVKEVRDSLYVYDLVSVGETIAQTKKLKETTTEIFADGRCTKALQHT